VRSRARRTLMSGRLGRYRAGSNFECTQSQSARSLTPPKSNILVRVGMAEAAEKEVQNETSPPKAILAFGRRRCRAARGVAHRILGDARRRGDVAARGARAAGGHAGATANLKLTFHLDHSAGADHSGAQF